MNPNQKNQQQQQVASSGSPFLSKPFLAVFVILAGGVKIAQLLGYIQFVIPYNILDWIVSIGAILGGLRMFPHYTRVLVKY